MVTLHMICWIFNCLFFFYSPLAPTHFLWSLALVNYHHHIFSSISNKTLIIMFYFFQNHNIISFGFIHYIQIQIECSFQDLCYQMMILVIEKNIKLHATHVLESDKKRRPLPPIRTKNVNAI
ncbi:hypothetical protein HanRHA438_Chr02g0096011 [Helianthus annuus]|nr:hypothetical protein HanRHA438_Chr02g0096011 [Helianthus annuus]